MSADPDQVGIAEEAEAEDTGVPKPDADVDRVLGYAPETGGTGFFNHWLGFRFGLGFGCVGLVGFIGFGLGFGCVGFWFVVGRGGRRGGCVSDIVADVCTVACGAGSNDRGERYKRARDSEHSFAGFHGLSPIVTPVTWER